jgi:hypothetical protein
VLEAGDAGVSSSSRVKGISQMAEVSSTLGGAGVGLVVDGVEADDLPGQVEAEHLLAALLVGGVGLDRAGLDHVEGAEAVSAAEQVSRRGAGAGALDDVVQPLHVLRGEAHRETERGEGAVLARDPMVSKEMTLRWLKVAPLGYAALF